MRSFWTAKGPNVLWEESFWSCDVIYSRPVKFKNWKFFRTSLSKIIFSITFEKNQFFFYDDDWNAVQMQKATDFRNWRTNSLHTNSFTHARTHARSNQERERDGSEGEREEYKMSKFEISFFTRSKKLANFNNVSNKLKRAN